MRRSRSPALSLCIASVRDSLVCGVSELRAELRPKSGTRSSEPDGSAPYSTHMPVFRAFAPEPLYASFFHHVPTHTPEDDLPFKVTAFEIDHCGAPRRQLPPSYVRWGREHSFATEPGKPRGQVRLRHQYRPSPR